MKNDWMLATLLIALFCFALPALADDAVEADPLPEEDTIIGMWHVQMMGGEVLPADEKVGANPFPRSTLLRALATYVSAP